MVFTIGESVLDIIIKDFDDVKIRPGGSMLNTAISLGRLGVEVSHLSFVSNDFVSDKLMQFLQTNKVDTSLIIRKAEKTNLALAFLDENNNASYTFYKEKKGVKISFNFPEINEGDIVLYGSFFCLNSDYRDSIVEFLKYAKTKEAVIMYDPNFRKAHQSELVKLKEYVIENFQLADIVKASDEDMMNLFEISNGQDAYNFLEQYDVNVLLYTQGKQAAQAFVLNQVFEAQPGKTNVISTIGAGDTFSAGVLYTLTNQNPRIIEESDWKEVLNIANLFAGKVCDSYDNYLSNNFIQDFKNV